MAETTQIEEIKPPVTDVGVIGWLRQHLFNGLFNSIATILILGFLIKLIPQFIQWAFIDSVWFTSGQECHQAAGACWSVITQNIRFTIFGYFPYEHQWRPLVAMIILVGMLVYSREWNRWNKRLGYAWIFALLVMGLLWSGQLQQATHFDKRPDLVNAAHHVLVAFRVGNHRHSLRRSGS